ncbi:hypothetical protein [Micromonospora chersina]|uniref:hypothetical protein n=1 Tax=Micromonospora chersina TaxID=47854 RepID=UPI00371B4393
MSLDQEPEAVEEDGPGRTKIEEPVRTANNARRKSHLLTAFGLPIASTEELIGWLSSEERRRVIRVFAWLVVVDLLAIISAGLITKFYVGASYSEYDSSTRDGLQASGVTSLASLYLLLGFVFYRRAQFRLYRDRVELEQAKGEVRNAETKLAERDSSRFDFTSLWHLTSKRLDYYHEIATQQANASFRRAQLAMGSGFAILLLALITSLLAQTLVSSITIAFIGGLSAALGGYIGRTFLRSQETASGNLQGYFHQPLELSRILIAERLLQELPEDRRADGTLRIIEGIVRAPEDSTRGSSEQNR